MGFLNLMVMVLGIFGLAYLVITPGNFVHEGLRLPVWLWKLTRLSATHPRFDRLAYGHHPRQYICHHPPQPGTSEKNHVVIYVHGSGWQFGKPEMFHANAQWLSSQGYHAFFISHRRIPSCDIREMRDDMALAIRAILDRMSNAGVAGKKILLAGNSAGGNLAALALLDPTILTAQQLTPDIFSAVALFAAPLDLGEMWPSPPLLMVTNWKKRGIYELANPICHLKGSLPIPMLIVHGDKDGIVEYGASNSFYNKLMEKGSKNVRFECLHGGLHLDAASWCFPGHQCSIYFKDWLESLEKGR